MGKLISSGKNATLVATNQAIWRGLKRPQAAHGSGLTAAFDPAHEPLRHCGGEAARGRTLSLQCTRGLRPALGVGDRRYVWATALFSGRASRADHQKKSTSAFRHAPLARSLTPSLRKTVWHRHQRDPGLARTFVDHDTTRYTSLSPARFKNFWR
jgi:hypothetical protein